MPDRDRFAAAVVSKLIEQRKKSDRTEKQIEEMEGRIGSDNGNWLFADLS